MEYKSPPQAEANDYGRKDESYPVRPTIETSESTSSHEEQSTTKAFRFFRSDEEQRRKIADVLQKGEPYKKLARRLLDSRGEFSEQQVNTIVKQVYGIEYNKHPFIFEEKCPDECLILINGKGPVYMR